MEKIKILFLSIIFSILSTKLIADMPYYLDFKMILNNSIAGKKAQDSLQKKLKDGIDSINAKERSLQEEEKKIIQQKKVISQEEYVKKVNALRKKVSTLQSERNNLLEKMSKDKLKARNELLKNLNPIIREYMKTKNIKIVMDKKSLILADESLDITKDIIKLLNDKIKSIKLN